MKKRLSVFPLLFLLVLSLAACQSKKPNLSEGDCPGAVAFTEIPKEFSLLDEHFMEQFSITVTLENPTTSKHYRITLDQENGFRQELSLHPGTYQVESVYANQISSLGIHVQPSAQSLTFAPDRQAILTLTVSNPEDLTKRWMEIQPMPEILLADKYSGLIQINRKVIPIKEILPELTLDGENQNGNLNPYQKLTLTDSEKGVTLHLTNPTDASLPWSECTVTGITVTKGAVLFPDGVSTDVPTDKVCHLKTGLYGEPTKITGTLLFGWNLATSSAVYSDPVTGNRITLNIHPMGTHISSITYELAVFE